MSPAIYASDDRPRVMNASSQLHSQTEGSRLQPYRLGTIPVLRFETMKWFEPVQDSPQGPTPPKGIMMKRLAAKERPSIVRDIHQAQLANTCRLRYADMVGRGIMRITACRLYGWLIDGAHRSPSYGRSTWILSISPLIQIRSYQSWLFAEREGWG